MRLLRSVTSRLVFFYCLLLALLGGAFIVYTVLSFRHYARDTVTRPIPVRIQVIWNIAQGSLEECRYYLILAQDLKYGSILPLMPMLEEISRILNSYASAILTSVS